MLFCLYRKCCDVVVHLDSGVTLFYVSREWCGVVIQRYDIILSVVTVM